MKSIFKVFLIVCLCLFTKVNAVSYYEILGIPEGTEDVNIIKSAYRQQALKYHPDKNKSNKQQNEEMLIKINEAYEYLIDNEKRLKYKQDQESMQSFNDILNSSSPELKKVISQIKSIWNNIPIVERNSLFASIKSYWKSEKFKEDLSLILQYKGVFKGLFRQSVLVLSMTFIFSIIGIFSSTIALFKFIFDVFNTVIAIISFPFRFIFRSPIPNPDMVNGNRFF